MGTRAQPIWVHCIQYVVCIQIRSLEKQFQFLFLIDFSGKGPDPTNEFENTTKFHKIGTLGSTLIHQNVSTFHWNGLRMNSRRSLDSEWDSEQRIYFYENKVFGGLRKKEFEWMIVLRKDFVKQTSKSLVRGSDPFILY